MKKYLSIAGLLVLVAILQLQLWGPNSTGEKLKMQAEEKALLKGRISGHTERNDRLLEEIKSAHNLDSIEGKARQYLGMIREGETFLFIPKDNPDEVPAPTEDN